MNSPYRDRSIEENLDLFEKLNPNLRKVMSNASAEEAILREGYGGRFQFIGHGYFIKDFKLSREKRLVFNRTVPLKSSYRG